MIKGPIPKMNHGKSISSPYKDKPVLKTEKVPNLRQNSQNSVKWQTLFL